MFITGPFIAVPKCQLPSAYMPHHLCWESI